MHLGIKKNYFARRGGGAFKPHIKYLHLGIKSYFSRTGGGTFHLRGHLTPFSLIPHVTKIQDQDHKGSVVIRLGPHTFGFHAIIKVGTQIQGV